MLGFFLVALVTASADAHHMFGFRGPLAGEYVPETSVPLLIEDIAINGASIDVEPRLSPRDLLGQFGQQAKRVLAGGVGIADKRPRVRVPAVRREYRHVLAALSHVRLWRIVSGVRRPVPDGGPNLHVVSGRLPVIFDLDDGPGNVFTVPFNKRPVNHSNAAYKQVGPSLGPLGPFRRFEGFIGEYRGNERQQQGQAHGDSRADLPRVGRSLPPTGIPSGNGGGPLGTQIAAVVGLWIAAWVSVACGLYYLIAGRWWRGAALVGVFAAFVYVIAHANLTHT